MAGAAAYLAVLTNSRKGRDRGQRHGIGWWCLQPTARVERVLVREDPSG
jgi:hypothetical protein